MKHSEKVGDTILKNNFNENTKDLEKKEVKETEKTKELKIKDKTAAGKILYDSYNQYLHGKQNKKNNTPEVQTEEQEETEEYTKEEVGNKLQEYLEAYAGSITDEDLSQSEVEARSGEFLDYTEEDEEYFRFMPDDEIAELSYVITEEEVGKDLEQEIRASHFTDYDGFHHANYREDAVEGSLEKNYVMEEGTIVKRLCPKNVEIDKGCYLSEYHADFDDLQLPQFESYYQVKYYVVNQEFTVDRSIIAPQGWQKGKEAYQYKITDESVDTNERNNVHVLVKNDYLKEISKEDLKKYN